MPTADFDSGSIDFIVALVGPTPLVLQFLSHVGTRFGLSPTAIEADPEVALWLGNSADAFGARRVFHLTAYESEHGHADGVIAVVGADPESDEALEDFDVPITFLVDANRTTPCERAGTTTCIGDVSRGVGVFEAIKLVTRAILERTQPEPLPRLPRCVPESA